MKVPHLLGGVRNMKKTNTTKKEEDHDENFRAARRAA